MAELHEAGRPSRTRRFLFAASCVLIVLVLGSAGAEAVLRWQARRIEGSNRLDPGLTQYDRTLGWRLTPGWSGTHRHYDYTVEYHISQRGLREPVSSGTGHDGPVIAVLGDSFTFGFGAGDDETFVSRMDDAMGPDVRVINFGVPGYSTDQEALLLERRLLHFRPALIVVVVYLGNDLIDNSRGIPVQAPRAKPYFTQGPAGLELANVPVPKDARPVRNAAAELVRAVLGEDAALPASRLVLWERAAAAAGHARDYRQQISEHNRPAVDLFWALAGRMASACAQDDVALVFALLPGRSVIERPASLSAQYQRFVGKEILRGSTERGLVVVDLGPRLNQAAPGRLYFPNDGHLTAAGHRVVADILVDVCRANGIAP